MLYPISFGTLISTIVLGGLAIIISVFSAFKSGHFKCNISKCCSVEMDDDSCEEKHVK